MTRLGLGTVVLVVTASLTLAMTYLLTSPDAPPVCAAVTVSVPEATPPAIAVPSVPKVLYVESVPGPLQRALAKDFDVTGRTPGDLPMSAAELAPYDLVLLSDVPMHLLDPHRIAVLLEYVRGGGSLFVAGGVDSFGSGGYEATPIEKALPVRFDSTCCRGTDFALVIVVDQRVSMQGGPMDDTREALRVLSETLSPSDYLAVIGFDDAAHIRVRLQRAANRARIAGQVAELVPSEHAGGDLLGGLHEAGEILGSIHAMRKHVVVIAGSETQNDHVVEQVREMRANGITTSTIGIHAADRNQLSMIAKGGDGRLYSVAETGTLPKVLAREANEGARIPDDDRVRVRITKGAPQLGIAHAPPLHGYVAMRAKPTAETQLESDTDEPLLARWCFGAGTVVAWTSDLDHAWSREWVRWDGYAAFWAQVVRTSVRAEPCR